MCRRGALELYAGYCLRARFAHYREHSIYDLIANGIALAKEFIYNSRRPCGPVLRHRRIRKSRPVFCSFVVASMPAA